MRGGRYCLVTPARNERAHIARTADAVAAQSVRPVRWVIVDDRSTDDTAAVAAEYAARLAFVSVVRRDERGALGFASKARAFARGQRELEGLDFDFLGNLDADVTFGPRFFERLIEEFDRDPRLGVAGGWVREERGGRPLPRFGNSARDVPGAVQLFRRRCLEDVGGFLPLGCGGEDAAAQATARMRGWEVRAFPDLAVDHHRPTPSGVFSGGAARFREGVRDRALGNHPLFELLKCARRAAERPYVLAAAMRLAGYAWSSLRGFGARVPPDVARFVRDEQLARVGSLLGLRAGPTGRRRR